MTGKPLSGIRVLDMGQGVAAPYCGLLLAQYGATVIKVEPILGDWMRGLGASWEQQTAYSIYYNLGKKGIAIDLKDPEGLRIGLEAATQSDVILENFRPGVVDRLGIGFEHVKKLNPKVLYASISGFGQSGVNAQRPGSDTVLQAFSGLISVNKDKDGAPQRVGTTIVDAITGLCAFQAVSMALFGGVEKAQLLDLSLLQSAAVLLAPNIADFYLNKGPATPLNAPAGTYRTSDGWIAITLVKEENFKTLCDVIEKPELAKDQRFDSFKARAENLSVVRELIQQSVILKTTQKWSDLFNEVGVLASPINNFGDWLEHPQVTGTSAYANIEQPEVGNVPIASLPGGLKLEGKAPGIGSHTQEVMLELGYSCKEIDSLSSRGIIFAPELKNE